MTNLIPYPRLHHPTMADSVVDIGDETLDDLIRGLTNELSDLKANPLMARSHQSEIEEHELSIVAMKLIKASRLDDLQRLIDGEVVDVHGL